MYMQRTQNFLWREFSSSSVSSFYYKSKPKPEKVYNYGLNKAERKHLKRRVIKANSDLKKHIYKESFNIENKYELAKQLISSEIYNERGLIAVVKPFGVRRYKEKDDESSSTIITTINAAGFTSQVSIEEALPLLQEHYGKKLDAIFTPERFSSGVLLLSSNNALTNRVQKCFRRSLGFQKPHQTFWAVVYGLTVPETFAGRVGISEKHVQNVGKIPVIKPTFSKGQVQDKIVKANIVEHLVLAHHPENDVSLVEVKVINHKHHFVRVWLAYSYSPVLGDRLFGGRVKMVMGKRVAVSSDNYSGYEQLDTPEIVLKKLNLSMPQAEIIPPHVHLSKLALNGYNDKDDLVLEAPPPDHFMWSCRQLELMSESDEDDKHAYEGLEIVEDDVMDDLSTS